MLYLNYGFTNYHTAESAFLKSNTNSSGIHRMSVLICKDFIKAGTKASFLIYHFIYKCQ